MKRSFNWSTDDTILQMVKELAAADDRKPSAYLNQLVKKAYEEAKVAVGH